MIFEKSVCHINVNTFTIDQLFYITFLEQFDPQWFKVDSGPPLLANVKLSINANQDNEFKPLQPAPRLIERRNLDFPFRIFY